MVGQTEVIHKPFYICRRVLLYPLLSTVVEWPTAVEFFRVAIGHTTRIFVLHAIIKFFLSIYYQLHATNFSQKNFLKNPKKQLTK